VRIFHTHFLGVFLVGNPHFWLWKTDTIYHVGVFGFCGFNWKKQDVFKSATSFSWELPMILHYRIFILPATPLRWDLRALGFAHCEFVYASSSSSANVCHHNYHTGFSELNVITILHSISKSMKMFMFVAAVHVWLQQLRTRDLIARGSLFSELELSLGTKSLG
jgi:hypothetical protein